MLGPILKAGIAEGLTPLTQSERMLAWIKGAMAAGLIILALLAWTSEGGISRWRFFTLGAFAALAAASVGGALGLLFGLPISSRVTVVNQSTPGGGGTAEPERDWFSDNTSMEQIADWLTKIIVGLTLTQWSAIQIQFNRMAAAVSVAMVGTDAGKAGQGLGAGTRLAPSDPSLIPGGVILAAYAVLGFVLVYLWSRRYLSAELAAGRGDSLRNQARAEDAFRAKANDAGAVQEKPRVATSSLDALSAARAAGEQAQPTKVPTLPFDQIVEPGDVPDDPWKGQFGGHSTDGRVAVTATVEELHTQVGWFGVELKVGPVTIGDRLGLFGAQARIYLHPSFPNSIQVAKFGTSGEIKLPLVCYEGFTLGVQLSDGRLFELDLCELPGVPETFKGS